MRFQPVLTLRLDGTAPTPAAVHNRQAGRVGVLIISLLCYTELGTTRMTAQTLKVTLALRTERQEHVYNKCVCIDIVYPPSCRSYLLFRCFRLFSVLFLAGFARLCELIFLFMMNSGCIFIPLEFVSTRRITTALVNHSSNVV